MNAKEGKYMCIGLIPIRFITKICLKHIVYLLKEHLLLRLSLANPICDVGIIFYSILQDLMLKPAFFLNIRAYSDTFVNKK
tara:strand:+ start:2282 stop:2524 length:243 start_codon:yes stop_codon:yes gene_type:complete